MMGMDILIEYHNVGNEVAIWIHLEDHHGYDPFLDKQMKKLTPLTSHPVTLSRCLMLACPRLPPCGGRCSMKKSGVPISDS